MPYAGNELNVRTVTDALLLDTYATRTSEHVWKPAGQFVIRGGIRSRR